MDELEPFRAAQTLELSSVDRELDLYLEELTIYLRGVVPEEDISRIVEETAEHYESAYWDVHLENGSIQDAHLLVTTALGSPQYLAGRFIEAWYFKASRLGPIERVVGPDNVCALALFGVADLFYWALLQFRIFLPSYSALHFAWSPAAIRHYFPEPLPFPDFSPQFLLLTGIPLLAPPILGWIVGRQIPVKPATAVYRVLMPLTILSYTLGFLLLPITDGLIFAFVQFFYWVPVSCAAAKLSQIVQLRKRQKHADSVRMASGSPLRGFA